MKHFMKALLALILAELCLCCATAEGADASASIEGKWYTTFTNRRITLEFKDGTMTETIVKKEETTVSVDPYTVNGSMLQIGDGVPTQFAVDGDTLILNVGSFGETRLYRTPWAQVQAERAPYAGI